MTHMKTLTDMLNNRLKQRLSTAPVKLGKLISSLDFAAMYPTPAVRECSPLELSIMRGNHDNMMLQLYFEFRRIPNPEKHDFRSKSFDDYMSMSLADLIAEGKSLYQPIGDQDVRMLYDVTSSKTFVRGPVTDAFLRELLKKSLATSNRCTHSWQTWQYLADVVCLKDKYTNEIACVKNRHQCKEDVSAYQDVWTDSEWELKEAIETGDQLKAFYFNDFEDRAARTPRLDMTEILKTCIDDYYLLHGSRS